MERRKKLKYIQLSLLILGSLIIFFTYWDKQKFIKEKIISSETEKKIEKQFAEKTLEGDLFFNISYSGFDLAGNRYVLKSKEAFSSKSNQEIVNMKIVEAFFYFKDDTVLNLKSKEGKYNNKTLDMTFNGDVEAFYQNSELFAQKAVYSNKNALLTITEKVKINDFRGTMFADKLLFDIKKKTLNITSFKNRKVNANISLK